MKKCKVLICEVHKLAAKLGLYDLATQDVDAIHRLPSKEGKIPAILTRFAQRKRRHHWSTNSTALKNDRIFLNENLGKQLKTLFWKMRL